LVIVTSAKSEHKFLTIVHLKIFSPVLKLLTVVLLSDGWAIIPVPDNLVHVPIPVPGSLADKVLVVPQTALSLPVDAVTALFVIIISSDNEQSIPPVLFVTVHWNVLPSGVNPLTLVLAAVASAIVPPPAVLIHKPDSLLR